MRLKLPLKQAFTKLELIVVIAILAIIATLLLSALAAAQKNAQRIHCVNNMKQIGTAYRIWGGRCDGRMANDLSK